MCPISREARLALTPRLFFLLCFLCWFGSAHFQRLQTPLRPETFGRDLCGSFLGMRGCVHSNYSPQIDIETGQRVPQQEDSSKRPVVFLGSMWVWVKVKPPRDPQVLGFHFGHLFVTAMSIWVSRQSRLDTNRCDVGLSLSLAGSYGTVREARAVVGQAEAWDGRLFCQTGS